MRLGFRISGSNHSFNLPRLLHLPGSRLQGSGSDYYWFQPSSLLLLHLPDRKSRITTCRKRQTLVPPPTKRARHRRKSVPVARVEERTLQICAPLGPPYGTRGGARGRHVISRRGYGSMHTSARASVGSLVGCRRCCRKCECVRLTSPSTPPSSC